MNLELLAQLTVSGFVLGSFYALLGVSFGLIYQTSKIFHRPMRSPSLPLRSAYCSSHEQLWCGRIGTE